MIEYTSQLLDYYLNILTALNLLEHRNSYLNLEM